jgi:hypothetical protein
MVIINVGVGIDKPSPYPKFAECFVSKAWILA